MYLFICLYICIATTTTMPTANSTQKVQQRAKQEKTKKKVFLKLTKHTQNLQKYPAVHLDQPHRPIQ